MFILTEIAVRGRDFSSGRRVYCVTCLLPLLPFSTFSSPNSISYKQQHQPFPNIKCFGQLELCEENLIQTSQGSHISLGQSCYDMANDSIYNDRAILASKAEINVLSPCKAIQDQTFRSTLCVWIFGRTKSYTNCPGSLFSVLCLST